MSNETRIPLPITEYGYFAGGPWWENPQDYDEWALSVRPREDCPLCGLPLENYDGMGGGIDLLGGGETEDADWLCWGREEDPFDPHWSSKHHRVKSFDPEITLAHAGVTEGWGEEGQVLVIVADADGVESIRIEAS